MEKKAKIKFGSLFDGAGTVPFAAQLSGAEAVWASEIEPFPIAVTKKRFPNMKHLGDITKINGADIEPVDVIAFGSNCQNLSSAGNGKGLEGEQSKLFFEAIRIIKEMREKTNGRFPTVAIWENVCGALSIHGGEDFRIVLEEMCRIKDSSAAIPRPTERGSGSTWADAGSILADGYSVAWRVLDAQFWGVPQRRRRIYLVADFRGQGAEEILFERAGLSRDFKTISKEWNSSAAASVLCSADTRQCYRQNGEGDGNTVPTLVGDHNNRVNFHTALVCGIDTFNKTETGRVSRTLVAGHQDADGVPCVAFHLLQDPISSFDVAPCISTGNSKTGQAAIGVVYALDRASYNQGKNAQYKISIDEDIAQTVVAKGPGAVCYFSNSSGNGISGTIDAHYYLGCGARSGKEREVVAQLSRDNLFVRRFTPTECGRSQGMPDWWCSDIEHSDAAEYKMWGNGMALPNILYVVENTVRVLQKRRRRAE